MLNNLNRRDIQIMGALFIIVVCLRLYFTLTTAHFAPDAYFHVRMVEHITEYSVPMTQDELFAGGRTMLFSPFFHYLLAILAWIVSLSMVLKIGLDNVRQRLDLMFRGEADLEVIEAPERFIVTMRFPAGGPAT